MPQHRPARSTTGSGMAARHDRSAILAADHDLNPAVELSAAGIRVARDTEVLTVPPSDDRARSRFPIHQHRLHRIGATLRQIEIE